MKQKKYINKQWNIPLQISKTYHNSRTTKLIFSINWFHRILTIFLTQNEQVKSTCYMTVNFVIVDNTLFVYLFQYVWCFFGFDFLLYFRRKRAMLYIQRVYREDGQLYEGCDLDKALSYGGTQNAGGSSISVGFVGTFTARVPNV